MKRHSVPQKESLVISLKAEIVINGMCKNVSVSWIAKNPSAPKGRQAHVFSIQIRIFYHRERKALKV